jgi:hypothetical protein
LMASSKFTDGFLARDFQLIGRLHDGTHVAHQNHNEPHLLRLT